MGSTSLTLVQHVSEVRNVLQLPLGDFPGVATVAELGHDLAAQAGPRVRVTRQVKEGGTEKTGGGVTAREENVQHVIAQHLRVIGIGSQSIEEDVSATLVLLLGVSLRVQRDADVVVHDFVDASVRVTEFLRVDQPVQSLGSGARSQIVLGSGESLSETLRTAYFTLLQDARGLGRRKHATHGFTKEEMRGRVESQ